MLKKILCIGLMMIGIGSQPTLAEICKIVDADGRVAYVEKSSCGTNQSIQVTEVNTGFTLTPPKASHEIPKYTHVLPPKTLILSAFTFFKDNKAQEPFKVGRYLFGEQCVGADAFYWPDIQETHPEFIPDDTLIYQYLNQNLRTMGYKLKLEVFGSLSTHSFIKANLVELTLETCVPKAKPGLEQLEGERFKASQFKTAVIEVTVRWNLTDEDGALINTFQTTGHFDSRKLKQEEKRFMKVQDFVSLGIKDAFNALLKEPVFQRHLPDERKPDHKKYLSLQTKIFIATIGFIMILVLLWRFTERFK